MGVGINKLRQKVKEQQERVGQKVGLMQVHAQFCVPGMSNLRLDALVNTKSNT